MRWLGLFLLFSCGAEEVVVLRSDKAVIRSLSFEREQNRGVSRGMNLDGFVSESNDGRSCFKEDFVAPDGTPGVDNELARLLPLVDAAGENAVEALLQGAIDEGRFMMFVDVRTKNDGTTDVVVLRGMDTPILGTDGRILEEQTLGLHEQPLLGAVENVTVDGDTITTPPFELTLPVIVFSQLYEIQMPRALLTVRLGDNGSVTEGLIAGGIPVEQLITVLETASRFAQDFTSLFGDAIREAGDLERDETGACTAMSAAVSFDSVRAFTFE